MLNFPLDGPTTPALALCLGESLVRCHGFDPKDQMERYCSERRWLNSNKGT
jgi:hypothetical protein